MSRRRIQESQVERDRRATVEWEEQFLDAEEEWQRQRGTATGKERERLDQEFSDLRRAYREEGEKTGKREPGIAMHRFACCAD